MKQIIKLIFIVLIVSSCTVKEQQGNMAYIGPISTEELSIRKILSDYESEILDSSIFVKDWKLINGKSIAWKKGEYKIDTTKGNNQKLVFPESKDLKTGDAMIFHLKMKNDRQQHQRYIGDMKGVKRIFIDGKEIFNAHQKLPQGEYDLLLVYIHKNSHTDGIPFTITGAMSGKLLPKLEFESPILGGEINLPSYENGFVEFNIINKTDGKKKPCRIYVFNKKGEPQYDDTCPDCFETFTCDGSAKLILPEGKYTYEIESGKEYNNVKGELTVVNNETIKIEEALSHFSDINSKGWFAGDLHNHTTIDRTALLMESENIHIAYVPWWWINPPMGRTSKKTLLDKQALIKLDNNRFIDTRVGEDERFDATLMFFGMPEEIEITNATWSSPPSVYFAKEFGKIEGVWVHLDHMFWWQTPAILASGELNSIEVLNNNFVHGGVNNTEAWGKPRDMKKYSGKYGNAEYQQDVYFKILNCGLRIPPAAGSAACVGGGPFGYNRVYAHVDGELTYKKWWKSLEEGKAFITNGPLLTVKANNKLPGNVFSSEKEIDIEIDFELESRDEVTEIQIIKNGEVIESLPFEDWKNGEKFDLINFKNSGWFLIRVLTSNVQSYRMAMSAPYYVEIGENKNHINKNDVKFFLDWAKEAADKNISSNENERKIFDKYSKETIEYWEVLYTK